MMENMWKTAVFLCVASAFGQLSPVAVKASTSVWEPEVMKAAKSLADSSAASPKTMLTLAESSGYQKDR